MNETLAETLPEVIKALLRGIHTAVPGKIEKYNRNTFRAEVTPSLSHLTLKNKEVKIQAIPDVPVLLLGGAAGIIDIELQKGDNVLLIFCEAGIGGWKSSDGSKQVSPDDLSHHQLNNAIAIPCLVPDGFNVTSRIKIDKNGRVSINDHFTVDP